MLLLPLLLLAVIPRERAIGRHQVAKQRHPATLPPVERSHSIPICGFPVSNPSQRSRIPLIDSPSTAASALRPVITSACIVQTRQLQQVSECEQLRHICLFGVLQVLKCLISVQVSWSNGKILFELRSDWRGVD